MPSSRTVACLEDKQALLKALKEHGYHRVMDERERILNQYFDKPKSAKEVDYMIRYYDRKSAKLSPYEARNGLRTDGSQSAPQLEPQALSKWHHVIPDHRPATSVIDQAFVDSLSAISSRGIGFAFPVRKILSFLSSLLDDNVGSQTVSADEALILLSLAADLESAALSDMEDSASLLAHISQSFWRLTDYKERGLTLPEEGDDALVTSLDPFKLAERLKLLQRIDEIVAVSMQINQQMTEQSEELAVQQMLNK